MKAAGVRELKQELNQRSHADLVKICLELSKFKKDTKELLTYLLFESDFEEEYIAGVKKEMDEQFSEINTRSVYYVQKSVRKILRFTKKHIRYSRKKPTQVELLIHFCHKMRRIKAVSQSRVLGDIYHKQLEAAEKALNTVHEDFQMDYRPQLEALRA